MDDRRHSTVRSGADVSTFHTPQKPSGADGFRLIETMRWEGGEVCYRARHAARLARSARYFGFPFSKEAFHTEVQQATAALPSVPHRLRLTLGPEGDLHVDATPLTRQEDEPLRLGLAERRAHSADPFFRHKTTWRCVYQQAFRAAQERGYDDALFLNERGEVTEATRANLFVEKDHMFYTPPVRCGLLPGVGRAVRLREEHVEERVLSLADLHTADALYLVSALRGVRRAGLDQGAALGT